MTRPIILFYGEKERLRQDLSEITSELTPQTYLTHIDCDQLQQSKQRDVFADFIQMMVAVFDPDLIPADFDQRHREIRQNADTFCQVLSFSDPAAEARSWTDFYAKHIASPLNDFFKSFDSQKPIAILLDSFEVLPDFVQRAFEKFLIP